MTPNGKCLAFTNDIGNTFSALPQEFHKMMRFSFESLAK